MEMSRSAALLLCLLGCNVWKAVTKTLGAPEAAQGRCGKGGGTGPLWAAAPGAARGCIVRAVANVGGWARGFGGGWGWGGRGEGGGGDASPLPAHAVRRLRGAAGTVPAADLPRAQGGEGSSAAGELLLTEGAGAAAGLTVQPPP